jgi:hypothetical protein
MVIGHQHILVGFLQNVLVSSVQLFGWGEFWNTLPIVSLIRSFRQP